jgi:hypothetical protein
MNRLIGHDLFTVRLYTCYIHLVLGPSYSQK